MSKGIRIQKNGGTEVLEYVDIVPGELGPHDVRVRNHAIGVNFIDIYFRTGLYPAPSFPTGLGAEGAGVVEAVGEAVTEFKPGDRVAYANAPLGAYADVHVIPESVLVPLPEAIGFDEAAAVMLKGLTVQYLFRRLYELKPGQTILFHAAAGGVGLIACQWAKALGVQLIGTAGSDEKARKAKELGAWETINYSTESIVDRVNALTNGQKCPVVYDSVGQATWDASLDCLQTRGLMVSFGNASGPVTGINLGVLAAKGSLYVTRPSLKDYVAKREELLSSAAELFDLMQQGKIRVEINQRLPLAEAGKAQQAIESRQTTGATILLPGS